MAENTVKHDHAPVHQDEGPVPATRERVRYRSPAVDIYEGRDGLMVVADLPGVRRDGLEISVEDNVLTIHGKPSSHELENPIYSEFALTDFFRQFTLGDKVDRDRIEASLEHGVLTLSLPHAEAAKPKLIKVQSA